MIARRRFLSLLGLAPIAAPALAEAAVAAPAAASAGGFSMLSGVAAPFPLFYAEIDHGFAPAPTTIRLTQPMPARIGGPVDDAFRSSGTGRPHSLRRLAARRKVRRKRSSCLRVKRGGRKSIIRGAWS